MSQFSDDDLAKLKERLILDRSAAVENSFPVDEIDSLEALLHRLECAERFCILKDYGEAHRSGDPLEHRKAWEAWRKACGK